MELPEKWNNNAGFIFLAQLSHMLPTWISLSQNHGETWKSKIIIIAAKGKLLLLLNIF
jgi:hypothetical protein